MATSHMRVESEDSPSKFIDRDKDQWRETVNDKSYERTVTTEPKLHSWMIVAAGAVVPLGLAGAALATTYLTNHEQVATTAWIAVAIVGSASVISAAAVSHRRSVSVDRDKDGNRVSGRSNILSKMKSD